MQIRKYLNWMKKEQSTSNMWEAGKQGLGESYDQITVENNQSWKISELSIHLEELQKPNQTKPTNGSINPKEIGGDNKEDLWNEWNRQENEQNHKTKWQHWRDRG